MKKTIFLSIFLLVLCIGVVSAQTYGCPVFAQSKNTNDFLNEIPALNTALSSCPATLQKSVSALLGSGIIQVDVAMNDGSTEQFIFVKSGQEVKEVKRQVQAFYHFLVSTDEDSVDQLLQSTNRFGTFSTLYAQKKIKISGGKFLSRVKLFFMKPILSFVTKRNQIPLQTIVKAPTSTIGPYPGKWACEFYQTPWPGVNKALVTCTAFKAGDNYCATVLQSPYARAEKCGPDGEIICSNPCEAPVQQIIPQRCPFDNDRARGNQAPPLNWCDTPSNNQGNTVRGGNQVAPPTSLPQGSWGKPDNCDDTFLPGHNGYQQNQATWDSYSANSDGVCQSQFGRGAPSPCVYTVQLSVSGNPYYLCWYNN